MYRIHIRIRTYIYRMKMVGEDERKPEAGLAGRTLAPESTRYIVFAVLANL